MSNTEHTEPFTNIPYWVEAYRYEVGPFAKLIAKKAAKLSDLENLDYMAMPEEERKRKWFYKEAMREELTTLYAFKVFADSMLRSYTKSMTEISDALYDLNRGSETRICDLIRDNTSNYETIDFLQEVFFKQKATPGLTEVSKEIVEPLGKPTVTT